MEAIALVLVVFFIIFVLGLYADHKPSASASEPQNKHKTSINYYMVPK
jgi:hypothetical protein